MAYIERTIKEYLLYLAAHFPVVVVTGARQVDFFDSDDGVTYVLYFISEKDARKSLGK